MLDNAAIQVGIRICTSLADIGAYVPVRLTLYASTRKWTDLRLVSVYRFGKL